MFRLPQSSFLAEPQGGQTRNRKGRYCRLQIYVVISLLLINYTFSTFLIQFITVKASGCPPVRSFIKSIEYYEGLLLLPTFHVFFPKAGKLTSSSRRTRQRVLPSHRQNLREQRKQGWLSSVEGDKNKIAA